MLGNFNFRYMITIRYKYLILIGLGVFQQALLILEFVIVLDL
jgi:hypothetical protein